MVLSKENGHVLGLVGLEHIKTMFFLFSVIGFTGSVGVMPRPLAVFDDKKTADKMIILHLMNDSTLALNNQ